MFYFLKKIFKQKFAIRYFNKYILPNNKPFNIKKIHNDTVRTVFSINTHLGEGGASKIIYNALSQEMSKRKINTFHLVNKLLGIKQADNIICLEKKISKDQKLLYKAMFELAWIDFFHLSTFQIKDLPQFKESDILHLNNLHGNYLNPFALPELTALKPTIWTLHDEYAFTGHCASFCSCDKWKTGCQSCDDLGRYFDVKKDTSQFLLKIKQEIYKNSLFTLVCPSNWLKNQVEQSILKDKDIKLIYNGIDENIFKPYNKQECREELGLPQDKQILLFASNCNFNNKQKGGKYLMETFNYFKNRKDVFFVALGNDKREYIADNFLCVEYIYAQKTMAKYYSAANLFIFPTLAETFGLVIAEALACETPVITFETGPTPELVTHLKNGYIAKYLDIKDFIKGIEIFLEDKNLQNNAAKNARQTVVTKFTLKRMIDEYENLYKEVFEKRKCLEK